MDKAMELGIKFYEEYKTVEEYFFERSTEDDYWEVIDGELIIHSPVATIHQKFARFLSDILSYYIRLKDLGELFYNPMVVRLDKNNIFEPDMFFVSKRNVSRIKDQYFDGAPDLIIEILSPSTAEYDRGWKFKKYEVFNVRELWLLDPVEKRWEFYRNVGTKFQKIGIEGDKFSSRVLEGFFFKAEWLNHFEREDPFSIVLQIQ